MPCGKKEETLGKRKPRRARLEVLVKRLPPCYAAKTVAKATLMMKFRVKKDEALQCQNNEVTRWFLR